MSDKKTGPLPELLMPARPWAIVVTFFTVASLVVLLYGFAFASTTIGRYLVAANVASISLVRSACYGSCPAYTVTLAANGRATFKGEAFVRSHGTFRADFNRSSFGPFANALYRRGLFVSRPRGAFATDVPVTTITVAFLDGSKATTAGTAFSGADDVTDDLYAGALVIDGFAGHICGWRRVEQSAGAGASGWYSPISTAPCPRRVVR